MKDLLADENLKPVNRFSRYYDRADKTPVTVDILLTEVR